MSDNCNSTVYNPPARNRVDGAHARPRDISPRYPIETGNEYPAGTPPKKQAAYPPPSESSAASTVGFAIQAYDSSPGNFNTHQENAALEICLLSQSVYPQSILRMRTTVSGTLPVKNPFSIGGRGLNELSKSIKEVCDHFTFENGGPDAIELVGDKRCFSLIQGLLVSALDDDCIFNDKNVVFSWKEGPNYEARQRVVIWKDSVQPAIQLLTLERSCAITIEVGRGGDSPSSAYNNWSVIEPASRYAPAKYLQFIYQQSSSGHCTLEDARAIDSFIANGATGSPPTEYWLSLSTQHVLQAMPKQTEVLSLPQKEVDETGDRIPNLFDSTGTQDLEASCKVPKYLAWEPLPGKHIYSAPACYTLFSVCHLGASFLEDTGLPFTLHLSSQLVHVGVILIFLHELVIMSIQLSHQVRERHDQSHLGIASIWGIILSIAWLIGAGKSSKKCGLRNSSFAVNGAGTLVYLASIIVCCILTTKPKVSYGDYMMLGACLKAQSLFISISKDSEPLKLSKDEITCLEYYNTCDIERIMAANDTPANQDYWEMMAIFYRIPYALGPGKDDFPNRLSRKCQISCMTRAQALQYMGIIKKALCKRLKFSNKSEAQFTEIADLDCLVELF